MSELEAIEVVESQEAEETNEQVESQEDSTADLATAETEEVKNETGDNEEKLRKQQEIIAQYRSKERVSSRRFKELEEENASLKSKLEPSFDGVVPQMPEPFDDDFDSKVRAREEALQRKARADAIAMQQREAEAEAQRKREREEFEQQQKLQADFKKNASDLGVDQQSLADAAQAVINYGVTPDIENAILSDANGPLMLQYLAANPLELSDLIEANPLRAGMLLADVKSKSLSLKPKPSSAPPPPQALSGRGAPQRERGPKGATFE